MGAADSKPNGSADAAVAVKSTDPTSSATPPVPAASPFAVAMKAHLLDLLFTAIDSSHVNYLDRTELITFISHEPYLDSPHLKPVVTALLSQLSHDEDSHCSRREWRAVFEPFQPVDITRLLINLIRQLPLPRKRLRHTLCNMEQPPENGAGNHDQQHRMCVYMERMLFLSIDATLNHRINMNELNEFITSDSYFTEHTSEQNAVQSLFTQLRDRKQAPPADGDSGDGGGGDGGGMTQAEFVGIFSGFSLQQVDELFVHLLTRTTHSSLTEAGCASRNAQKPVRHKQMLQDVMRKHVPVHTQEPCRLVHGGEVQRQQPGKPKTFLAMPPSVLPPPHGVRLTLLGQSLIQYDLRETDYGRRVLSSLPPYLTADIVFSELETSISYTNNSDQQQRHTVYQHNAPPVVLDCLKQLGINMLALANNHAGDMGEDGVRVALEEVRKRGFVCAGLGLNEAEATQPTFTTVTPLCWQLKHGPGHTTTDESTDSNSSNSPTLSPTASHSPSTSPPPPPTSPPSPLPAFQSPCPPSVTVALVAHASKIPPGSAATATHAGVNSLSMSDMDTYTLDETDCARILTSTSDARQHASIVIAYQHNHYWSACTFSHHTHSCAHIYLPLSLTHYGTVGTVEIH